MNNEWSGTVQKLTIKISSPQNSAEVSSDRSSILRAGPIIGHRSTNASKFSCSQAIHRRPRTPTVTIVSHICWEVSIELTIQVNTSIRDKRGREYCKTTITVLCQHNRPSNSSGCTTFLRTRSGILLAARVSTMNMKYFFAHNIFQYIESFFSLFFFNNMLFIELYTSLCVETATCPVDHQVKKNWIKNPYLWKNSRLNVDHSSFPSHASTRAKFLSGHNLQFIFQSNTYSSPCFLLFELAKEYS